MKPLVKLLLLALLCSIPSTYPARAFCIWDPVSSQAAKRRKSPRAADDPIARAFADRTSNIQVEGKGTVIRVLPDDLKTPRHQRFIVKLASGQTLLINHNIDIALRISALEVGDKIRFYGEYVWNDKGGLIHWTHHDPRGRHVTGWVIHNGTTYQ